MATLVLLQRGMKNLVSTRNGNVYLARGDILVVHRHPGALVGFDHMGLNRMAQQVVLWKKLGQYQNQQEQKLPGRGTRMYRAAGK
jgi:hypothetical protein